MARLRRSGGLLARANFACGSVFPTFDVEVNDIHLEDGALLAEDRAALFNPDSPFLQRRGAEFGRLEAIGVIALAANQIEANVTELAGRRGPSDQLATDKHILIVVAHVVV